MESRLTRGLGRFGLYLERDIGSVGRTHSGPGGALHLAFGCKPEFLTPKALLKQKTNGNPSRIVHSLDHLGYVRFDLFEPGINGVLELRSASRELLEAQNKDHLDQVMVKKGRIAPSKTTSVWHIVFHQN